MQGLRFGLPVVEASCDTNDGGCGMREFKTNGHEAESGAFAVIMILVVFHCR